MPNWCDNSLRVWFDERSAKQVDYIKRMMKACDEGKLLNFLVPMPAHQPDITKPNPFYATGPLGNTEEKLYGENNCWYHWSIDNWGTKWEADGVAYDLSEGMLAISFATAWSPPTEAIKGMLGKVSSFMLMYYETGAGYYGYADSYGDHSKDLYIDDTLNRADENVLLEGLVKMCREDDMPEELAEFMVGSYYDDSWEPEKEENENETTNNA